MSSEEFWRLTWWEWNLRIYRYYRQQEKETASIERTKFLYGYLMSTIVNVSGKTVRRELKPEDFFEFAGREDTQPDEVDLLELMRKPDVQYRFRRDG